MKATVATTSRRWQQGSPGQRGLTPASIARRPKLWARRAFLPYESLGAPSCRISCHDECKALTNSLKVPHNPILIFGLFRHLYYLCSYASPGGVWANLPGHRPPERSRELSCGQSAHLSADGLAICFAPFGHLDGTLGCLFLEQADQRTVLFPFLGSLYIPR